MSSSVNAYRRLDPNFEAPNQIKVSPIDRGSMIRIPVGNEKTARIELRSVAPDANPYLVLFTMLKTGLEGRKLEKDENKRDRVLSALGIKQSRDRLQAIMDKHQRKASHTKATQARAKQEFARAEQQREERERARAAAWVAFAAAPEVQALSVRQRMALFAQRFPEHI